MRADDALGEAFDGEMLEANLAIRLAGRMHDHEIPGMPGGAKPGFDGFVDRLRDAHQGEPVNRDRGTVRDGGRGFPD